MRRRTALAAVAAAGIGPLQAPMHASAAPATPGQEVTWPEVTLLDGSRLDRAALGTRPVVAVFWSTTCPFCRRHNQHVEKLHRAAAGRGLLVLGIARDRDAEKVRSYARAQGYTFPITMDHAPLAAALSSRNVIPLTVTVDRQGRLRQVIPGEMFEEDVLELARLAG
jgi:thiol-disulfide isomerase/thioredoxin